MDACDIRQYFIRQNVFCTISPNITLANISSYMVPDFLPAIQAAVDYLHGALLFDF